MTSIQHCRPAARFLSWNVSVLLGLLLLFLLVIGTVQVSPAAGNDWPQRFALSKDKTPISYEVHGAGEPTLLFVHGWSCDARYWRMQIDRFAQKYRVVVLDLAGHGHSGMMRGRYTMQLFGEDVRAVAEAVGSKTVILIGHSMGGAVIAEAARLMPERVIGLIGVDTFDNIEYPLTRAELDRMLAPMVDDFRRESRKFVADMVRPSTDPQLREWILADISSAPPYVALSAMEEMMAQYITGEAARIFEEIKAPVICVNGDLWPIDFEANRRHMRSFDALILKETDHFLMLDRPYVFNQALEQAIHAILRRAAE
jgi:pimeloyl-ACP methyl ester carboxylesterase